MTRTRLRNPVALVGVLVCGVSVVLIAVVISLSMASPRSLGALESWMYVREPGPEFLGPGMAVARHRYSSAAYWLFLDPDGRIVHERPESRYQSLQVMTGGAVNTLRMGFPEETITLTGSDETWKWTIEPR